MLDVEVLPPAIDVVRERLRGLIQRELMPREAELGIAEESDVTPEVRRWVRTRADQEGVFRAALPSDLGGTGFGPLALAALAEEAAASGSVLARFTLGGDGGLLRHGNAQQHGRFLLPVLRGELAAAFAFTDAREGPRTTAVRRGDVFLVTGVKAFVTDGPQADLLVVVANVTENAAGATGTAVLVMRRDAPGVTLRRELRTLDGGVHGEFAMHEVPVPATDVIGAIGQGLPRAREGITVLRLRAAAAACGTARWALEHALRETTRPHRSGIPVAEREGPQGMLAESAIELFAARSALYAAARHAAADTGASEQEVPVAMAKALATEAVARIVDRAIQLTGSAAIVEGHPLARLYRRVRGWRIGEGTTEALRLVVARRLVSAYCAVQPPSITSSLPVTNDASSDAR
jgi:alkylation response protein AidB-like acyl-CoA dehydrogenase